MKESNLKKVDTMSHAKAKLQAEYDNLQQATTQRDD